MGFNKFIVSKSDALPENIEMSARLLRKADAVMGDADSIAAIERHISMGTDTPGGTTT